MANELDDLARQAVLGHLSRRDFMGRAAALGLAGPAATALLGRAAAAAGPQKGGQLKIGMVGGAATDSLDPATFSSQVPYTFGRYWGETLTETSPVDGSAVPVLAESWSTSDDAKTWRFKIRKGVSFHDGRAMTVGDVVATLVRHSGEGTKSGALGMMRGIDRIEGSGEEVVIRLKEANVDLPLLLSDYHLIVQPNGGVDKPDAGIGTGPYKVETAQHGVRYLASRVKDHWRDGVGHVDSIEILVINDLTARTAALMSGQVHLINRVDPKTVDLLKRNPNVAIENVSGKGQYVFLMHCDKEPFSNPELRLAMKLAMDRETMLKQVLRGYGRIGNDFPINEAYELFPDDIPQRPYDPDQAKYHYQKSGHSGPILLRTSDVAFPGANDAAVLYQQACAKAGITVEIKREPGDGYWSEVWNKQPFSTSYWGGRPTQDQMYATAYVSTADWNDTKWFRPEFDKLLAQARGELDKAKRKAMYRQLALMVRDDGGLILPMFNDYIDARSAKVQGFVKDPAGELSNGFAGMQVWLTA